MKRTNKGIQEKQLAFYCALLCKARLLATNKRGQGTTEYAILVGVLVVIAIIAVIAFKDNIQTLWDNITNSINSL
jgi:Flp pilus assembly pilin Flp